MKIRLIKNISQLKDANTIIEVCENCETDNKFGILETKSGNIGFSFYGDSQATYRAFDNVIFLCLQNSFFVIDIEKKEIIGKSQSCYESVYSMELFEKEQMLIIVSESSLYGYDLMGKEKWKNSYPFMIDDWYVENDVLCLSFDTGDERSDDVRNGNISC